jgi:uncharacterized membrane protein
MAFCSSCGAKLEDDAKFCASCGAKTGASEKAQPNVNVQETFDKIMDTPDTTAEFDADDINNNKVMAVLAYIWILFLVPLLVAKDSKFARYHANQGIILFLASIVISVVGIIPVLGWIVSAVGGIIVFVLAIIGIINAAKGNAKQLPIIGGLLTVIK